MFRKGLEGKVHGDAQEAWGRREEATTWLSQLERGELQQHDWLKSVETSQEPVEDRGPPQKLLQSGFMDSYVCFTDTGQGS
ncbi:hypothetical protein Y1Q_0020432 [Alligator mississippiensis]|uniref:Uncharacterized protein n=1 Tax=Alligator mississippiensis TaxID=8496 RepID=A0A151N6P1_ALLMI|nr:hypothetical protein Y1Q_0020432 [Alligator mississippiensis]